MELNYIKHLFAAAAGRNFSGAAAADTQLDINIDSKDETFVPYK